MVGCCMMFQRCSHSLQWHNIHCHAVFSPYPHAAHPHLLHSHDRELKMPNSKPPKLQLCMHACSIVFTGPLNSLPDVLNIALYVASAGNSARMRKVKNQHALRNKFLPVSWPLSYNHISNSFCAAHIVLKPTMHMICLIRAQVGIDWKILFIGEKKLWWVVSLILPGGLAWCQLYSCSACSRLVACGPNFCPIKNAIKGVACVQTSVPLRNATKKFCLQRVVYTYVSLTVSLANWTSHFLL